MRIIPSTFTKPPPAPGVLPGRLYLLLHDLFDLPDFLLDLAAEFLTLAFGLQVRVVGNPSGFFFRATLLFRESCL
jgi:hypothetical protein